MDMTLEQREHRPSVVRLPRARRLPRVPRWAVIIFIAWLGLIGLCEWLEPAGANAPSLCKVKAITGVACPTCGSTRAVKAAAHGRLLDAWMVNPFVVTAIFVAGAWLVLRIIFRRSIQLTLSKRMRTALWTIISILFAANWLYLIVNGR